MKLVPFFFTLFLLLGGATFLPEEHAVSVQEGRYKVWWQGEWVGLGEVPHGELYKADDPARFLPQGLPLEIVGRIEAIHARMERANQSLWVEVVSLWDEALLLSKRTNSLDADYRAALLEGVRIRLEVIDSNRYHFFLDAVLEIPLNLRESWFRSVESWTPPPIIR
ncbi:hypothetical protein H8D30_00620 [bacterium]|nr:hypothetical protein [bacterium]